MGGLLRPLVTVRVEASYKIKTVFFLWDELDHIAGVDEAHQSQQYLQRGVSHFYELEVQQTAWYRDVAVVLRRPGRGRGDGRHLAPWPVLHPPRAVHGQVECQHKVRVPGQISNLQVKTDDEDIPGHPHHQPGRVPSDISGSELDGAKQAEDDHDDVQEVGEDGSPLVSQEVDYLSLQNRDQLHSTDEGESTPATTAPHGVRLLLPSGSGAVETNSPISSWTLESPKKKKKKKMEKTQREAPPRGMSGWLSAQWRGLGCTNTKAQTALLLSWKYVRDFDR